MGYTIEKSFATGYVGSNLTGKNLVIAHESGNPNNVGSNSLNNEISYMKNNIKSANVTHWVGGGGRIVQILPTGKVTWGVGGKGNPYSYAQVELARTNNKETFKKDYAAYIWLLRALADEAGIPKTLDTGSRATDKGIKTHLWVSNNLGNTNHTDPYGYLASWGISKEQFKSDVAKGVGAVSVSPSKPNLSGSYTVKKGDTLWGIANTHKSTVASLKSLNGLKTDIITPGQVLKLSGTVVTTPVTPKPVAKSIDTLVAETRAGKHSNGDARKKSLGSNYDAVMKVINGGSTSTPVAKNKRVYLPKSAKTWRVYKTSGPYTTGKEVGFLAPAQYGGLDYEIIKTLATDVYQIKTSAFGNVAIYAAKSTGATIK